ncbi:MAG: hypothetical protein GC190_13790 [Alphaproteobacteria bacterium]|nr:hypothetical protein [Alphaproteobacteria bacterium]
MRGSAQLALVLLATAPLLQGCSLFGDKPARHYATQANPDCARLRPLAAPGADLTRTEMETWLQTSYKKYDADSSGELSMSEVAPVNQSLRDLNVNAAPVMDINGDGRINFQEFASGWRTMFDYCAHGSGDVVSQNDMQNSPNVSAPVKAQRTSKPGASTSPDNNTGGLPRH